MKSKLCKNCGKKIKINVQHNCPPDEKGWIRSTIWSNKWE